MLYIIVEDVKAGYDLWSNVIKNLLNNNAKLLTCSGIKNLKRLFANMFMSFTVFKDVSFSSLDSFKESFINIKNKC